VAPGTGILLNDTMDDFTAKPGTRNTYGLVQGQANAIAPHKTPLSSMSPTIVTKDGRLVMVLGSPGGSRIITIVLETFLNMVEHGMTVQEAVDAPRVHHQWQPDKLFVEPFAVSADTRAALERMGYSITEQAPWGASIAILADGPAIGEREPGNNEFGGIDSRRAIRY
jgi:gamma-glutamyltranspeptidase/glutathione hydrolase